MEKNCKTKAAAEDYLPPVVKEHFVLEAKIAGLQV